MNTSTKSPAARERGDAPVEEQRREERQPAQNSAFVQLVETTDPDEIGLTFPCEVIDVSPSGMRISSETLIPDGARIDMWIDVGLPQGKVFLSGEIRWVHWEDSGECQVGVQILDSRATDVDQWREIHA